MKSAEEKNKSTYSIILVSTLLSTGEFHEGNVSVKARLMEKYKTVPDRVVMLAMDSVDYDEERAIHILDIVVAEEATRPICTSSSQR